MPVLHYDTTGHPAGADVPRRAWAALQTGAAAAACDAALYFGVSHDWLGEVGLVTLALLAPALAFGGFVAGVFSFCEKRGAVWPTRVAATAVLLSAAAFATYGKMVFHFLTHLPRC